MFIKAKLRNRQSLKQLCPLPIYAISVKACIEMYLEKILPVRLTVTTASKKKGLKKFVAWPITFRRTVGR